MGILQKVNRSFQGDSKIWVIYLIFSFISMVEVFSATSALTYKAGSHWSPLLAHASKIFLGFVLLWVTHRFSAKLMRVMKLGLPVAWGLLIVAFFSSATNDAHRWISILGIPVQPSEIAKLMLIILVANILNKAQEEKGAAPWAFKYILIVTGITCALIVTENLTTCILIGATVFMMMILGRVPWKQLLKLTAVMVGGVVLGLILLKNIPVEKVKGTPIERAITWSNRITAHSEPRPENPADYVITDKNFQRTHGYFAIANSKGIGVLPGNSVERDRLPQAYSDMIFAIIIEETGLLGALIVIALYIYLLMRIWKIVHYSDNYFLNYTIMGIGIMMCLQALINMFVSVGLMPITGQPLPLISRGGTSMLITSVAIGLILGVSKYAEACKEALENPEDMDETANELVEEMNVAIAEENK